MSAPTATLPLDYRAFLTETYRQSSALHAEAARIRDTHGEGYLYDPHYVLLGAALAGIESARESVRVILLAQGQRV